MRFQGDASELALWAEILESPALGLAVYVSPSGGRFQNLGFDGVPRLKIGPGDKPRGVRRLSLSQTEKELQGFWEDGSSWGREVKNVNTCV